MYCFYLQIISKTESNIIQITLIGRNIKTIDRWSE